MSELRRPEGATKQRKRLGRGPGSGNGTTAGKGTKGQNARSGGHVRPGFEGGQMPLYRRIARRGFSNYRFKTRYAEIDVAVLEKLYNDGDTVNPANLAEHGLLDKRQEYAKILGTGTVSKKLTLEGVRATAGAKKKIEAAGGTVVDASTVEESAAEEPATETSDTTKDE